MQSVPLSINLGGTVVSESGSPWSLGVGNLTQGICRSAELHGARSGLHREVCDLPVSRCPVRRRCVWIHRR